MLSKYLKRPSPPYPAQENCYKELKGNDGNMYISSPDKNNICKWKKLKEDSPKSKKSARKSPKKSARKSPRKSPKKSFNFRPKSQRVLRSNRKSQRVLRSNRKSQRVSRSNRKSQRVSRSNRDSGILDSVKCKELLSEKIAQNMREYKEGKYVSRKQSLAVSYSQIKKKYPECSKFLKK
jgi:hypothetical protein